MVTLSRPARGAWVEILTDWLKNPSIESRPARGAWVEIVLPPHDAAPRAVAPRKGRVG